MKKTNKLYIYGLKAFKFFNDNIVSHIHTQWFNVYWWQYLLEKPKDKSYTNWWVRFWCRASYHPCGVWYFSHGNCRDMTCKNCGDDLG